MRKKISDLTIRNSIKPKLAIGEGLYLKVRGGCKSWHRDFTMYGRRQTYTIGTYPNTSLNEAKLLNLKARELIKKGINPKTARDNKNEADALNAVAQKKQQVENSNTFEVVAHRWLEAQRSRWADATYEKQASLLDRGLVPLFRSKPVAKIARLEITQNLEKVAKIKSPDAARRLAKILKNVLDYACNSGYIEYVPMGNMAQVLPAHKPKHYPAITDSKQLGDLLRAIDNYKGLFVTSQALKILPYLVVRSGEFRQAQWCDFDLEQGLWTIPAKHRKLKQSLKADETQVHIVPLPRQAITILEALKEYTGQQKYVFMASSRTGHMGASTINNSLEKIGFRNVMCGHGWRTTFSTLLNEQGFNPDAIEKQLSHVGKDVVRAAYNRGDYLDERTAMMQQWADYLDALKVCTKVVPFKRNVG